MRKLTSQLRLVALFIGALFAAGEARAQWATQPLSLQPGWNAVFLHVDASYGTLQDVMTVDAANPIQEVWLWAPAASSAQFVDAPQLPTSTGNQWVSWTRALGPSSALQHLAGNQAYLVRVGGSTPYTWNLKGQPLSSAYQWTSSGLNFIGFPTPAANPPSFDAFLSPSPDFQRSAEIYHYTGGDLGPGNPARVFALRTTPVKRGEAFWIRSGTLFNNYFGPFEVAIQNPTGVQFHDAGGQNQFHLRNLTASALTVTLKLVASDSAPGGQAAIVGTPPILVRGNINTTNLTYTYSNLLTGPQTWTLPPKGEVGSDLQIVVGVNRSALTGNAGDLYAGILRFTDSTGLSQVDIGVSATVGNSAGLWVGNANVDQVGQYLKNYQLGDNGQPLSNSDGSYTLTSVSTNLGLVTRAFPLRLILHSDAAGNASLLQRVYYGIAPGSNIVVATLESALDPARLASARRISSTHLPWRDTNATWAFSGVFGHDTNFIATVNLDYREQASNPFLHTYHPDHDNFNSTYDQALTQGEESYGIARTISLTLKAPQDDFASLTAGGESLVGTYDEKLTFASKGSQTRDFRVRGTFSLKRISAVPTLTRP